MPSFTLLASPFVVLIDVRIGKSKMMDLKITIGRGSTLSLSIKVATGEAERADHEVEVCIKVDGHDEVEVEVDGRPVDDFTAVRNDDGGIEIGVEVHKEESVVVVTGGEVEESERPSSPTSSEGAFSTFSFTSSETSVSSCSSVLSGRLCGRDGVAPYERVETAQEAYFRSLVEASKVKAAELRAQRLERGIATPSQEEIDEAFFGGIFDRVEAQKEALRRQRLELGEDHFKALELRAEVDELRLRREEEGVEEVSEREEQLLDSARYLEKRASKYLRRRHEVVNERFRIEMGDGEPFVNVLKRFEVDFEGEEVGTVSEVIDVAGEIETEEPEEEEEVVEEEYEVELEEEEYEVELEAENGENFDVDDDADAQFWARYADEERAAAHALDGFAEDEEYDEEEMW
ncbi:hypothetical protein ACQY0O_006044 [Thecaphora frezii]